MKTRWAGCIVVLLSPFVGGCVRLIPPPAVPEAVAPELAEAPPLGEGNGRVVVDVVDGPTEVLTFEIHTLMLGLGATTYFVSASSAEPLCVSPCIVDLPLGRYRLGFRTRGTSGRLEVGEVDAGPVPTVYRRALGSYESGGAGLPLGILGVIFGGMSLVTGMVLLPVGLASDDGAGMTLAGGVTLAAGGFLTTLGIVAIAVSPSTRQPGASLQFALP